MLLNAMCMKRWIWLIVLTLLTWPALAQDEGGGGGGDFFDLGSMGDFGNVTPDFDPLVEVRNLLAQARVTPMDKQQEKDLKKVYDKEVKVVAKPYEKRFGLNLKTVMGSLQTSARGRRGGGGGRGGSPARQESTQVAEARRLAGVLVDKMIAGLRMDQQGPLRRHQSEQARIAKLNTLTNSMSTAGTPLTVDQLREVEAILARESRLRSLVIVEAKGGSYQSQIVNLEAQTKQRVVDVLDTPQKIAYAAATAPAAAQPARSPARPPVRRGTN
jgi:hypothetical protein